MKNHHLFFIPTAAIALSALWALSASAQTTSAAASDSNDANDAALPSEAAPAAVAVDETKLEKFADAYVKIQTLQKDAMEKQKSTSDPTAAQQQQAELQNKMTEAVQTSGLDVTEFNQIAQAMVSDTALRAKVIAKVQQRNHTGG